MNTETVPIASVLPDPGNVRVDISWRVGIMGVCRKPKHTRM